MKAAPAPVATCEEAPEIQTADPVGFWLRLATFLVDSAVVAGGSWILAFFFGQLTGVLDLFQVPPVLHWSFLVLIGLTGAFYFSWSWRNGGQTLGKRLTWTRVIHTDARPLTWRTSFLRFLGLLVCFAFLGIPLLLIGFDGRKQGLHDKIAKTYVISVPKKKVRVAQPSARPAIEHV